MYKKQFLLTKEKEFKYNWNKIKIKDFYLFIHPDLEYNFSNMNNTKLHFLGSIYDYKFPELSNKKIIEELNHTDGLDKLLKKISNYSGEFVVIYENEDTLIIFNDAFAQAEIYYDDAFSCFGTQPKLMGEIISLKQHNDSDAIDFYKSDIFRKKKLFIYDSTHVKNIKHLLPNHYINITNKAVTRFYPNSAISERPIDEIAKQASTIIKGYIKAISLRHNAIMAVTGGYDSRVLFLASLENEMKYFVSKHKYMTDRHHDIFIPKHLTSLYNKEFHIVSEATKTNNDFDKDYINSVDFPRFLNLSKDFFSGHIRINGNLSETARNSFGYHKHISSKDLSFLKGYSTHSFPVKKYKIFLKENKELFNNLNYNLLDMFYWEEYMGIWASKTKTEANAQGITIVSPFNSRYLMNLLLSVRRKYRDSHNNKLYDKIISYLSNNNSEVTKLPINPCPKQNIIRLMKNLKIYNLYRAIGLKTRKIKIL